MKQITATVDEETKRPIIAIEGDWTGKDIKMLIKMLPRQYRIYKADRVKQVMLDEKKPKSEGVKNAKPTNKRAGNKTTAV